MVAVPPVHFPTRFVDIAMAIFGRQSLATQGTFTASGTDGLTLAFQTLAAGDSIGPSCDVIVPDFICQNVINAVQAANMSPIYCPINPKTWFYDLDKLQSAVEKGASIATIVSYFGHPPNISDLEKRRAMSLLKPCKIVADAAQAFSPDFACWLWSDADITVFSFGPGKSLPLNWGGLVMARNENDNLWLSLHAPQTNKLTSVINLFAAYGQSILLKPQVWNVIPLAGNASQLPNINRKKLALSWPASSYISLALDHLSNQISGRRQLAKETALVLKNVPRISVPSIACIERGASLRLPVVFEDSGTKRAVETILRKQRIIKGQNEWSSYGHCSENARAISEHLITLPTFPAARSAVGRALQIILAHYR